MRKNLKEQKIAAANLDALVSNFNIIQKKF